MNKIIKKFKKNSKQRNKTVLRLLCAARICIIPENRWTQHKIPKLPTLQTTEHAYTQKKTNIKEQPLYGGGVERDGRGSNDELRAIGRAAPATDRKKRNSIEPLPFLDKKP
jgi:hypothetical protein